MGHWGLTMWCIKPPPTGGREAHPAYLSLFSPFLDIGAACPPPTLTAHHSIMATHVAPVCSGWNHHPAVSFVCFQYVKEHSLVGKGGVEPPPRLMPSLIALIVLALSAPFHSVILPKICLSRITLSVFSFKTSVLHSRLGNKNNLLP